MTKVMFIYDGETDEDILRIYSKMTPGRKGIWKDMVGVCKEEEADFFVVIDQTSRKLPDERCIYHVDFCLGNRRQHL